MYTDLGDLDVDVRKNILNYLKSKGISVSFLASRVDYHKIYLINVLNCKEKLSDKLRLKINEVLETDF